MLISRASPHFAISIFLMAFLFSCSNAQPPSSNSEESKQLQDQQQHFQQQLEKAQEIALKAQSQAEQAQKEVESTKQSLTQAHTQAEAAQQQSSFLKGALLAGILIALLLGVAMGSKAKRDSLKSKEVSVHDENSRKSRNRQSKSTTP